MAGRPQKNTVDYFTHDALASDGRTVSILENHFGPEGYMAWFKLLERISLAKNHIILVGNAEDMEFLAAKMRLKPERLKEILSKMADLEAIDKELYAAGMIWSQNFVDRLKGVYESRKQALPPKPCISVANNAISAEEMPISLPENTQSTLPKSRGDKRRVKKDTREPFIELPEWIEQKAWDGFLDMRRAKGRPPTQRALELIVEALSAFKKQGDDPNAVLNQSIINNWTDVFRLKSVNGHQPIRPAPGRVSTSKEMDEWDQNA
jgi:hypothetical protein